MKSMLRRVDGGVLVSVAVVPGATRDAIVGPYGDRLKIRVSAPPENGKANAALVELLVAATAASSGEVVSGRGHRFKTVKLDGVAVESVRRALDVE